MPELPEVETIRRGLKAVQGRRIESAEFGLPRLILGSTAGELTRKLQGRRIEAILRRGKYLVLELDTDTLVVHLGMTGQLTHAPANAKEDVRFIRTVTGLQKALGVHPVDKHTHAVLHLDDGSRVQFRDPRTFGKIIFIKGHAWEKNPRIQILGEEPLDLKIEPFLKKNFPARSRRPVKALLLDQSFLAGVGNIYADEALFASGLHPKTLVTLLQPAERIRLLTAVKTVLRKGIRYQGTTFSDYRKPDGSNGDNFERLMVYGRGGKPCRSCGTTLQKIIVAQRGTVFCLQCQPPRGGKKRAILKTVDKPRRPSHN